MDLQCGSRILYQADADDKFVEYELDYIIFAKKNVGTFQVNKDEVKGFEFISLKDFDDFVKERMQLNEGVTPWFNLIKQTKLKFWWQ